MKQNNDKKHDSTKHLKDEFMNTPVASVTESTGSNNFIGETTYKEKTSGINQAEAGTNHINKKKK